MITKNNTLSERDKEIKKLKAQNNSAWILLDMMYIMWGLMIFVLGYAFESPNTALLGGVLVGMSLVKLIESAYYSIKDAMERSKVRRKILKRGGYYD